MCYVAEGASKLCYSTNRGGKWATVTLIDGALLGDACDLAVDKAGAVHACFLNWKEEEKQLQYVTNARPRESDGG